ncbi:anti-sigma factor [Mycobacterium intracellulare]|uniref:Anti-sigma-K factor RskA n=1 Tax=Mycobacterium intracellulare subsp. chimaera TaxID=222805 RepID=A0A7U5MPW7_MYCIT|nr:anti-sigma factor [Mycobacterium intracellulare]ASL17568.1 disfunctional anti-sigma-K factor [Mycobacterium intracellulare subsp. chimaera]MDM3929504.1 anti-sigma factor [Mycobacterium intracellulare subsp. chimaera]
MTDPTDFELLELAAPYALHAMSDEERDDVERRVAAAPSPVAAAFADEVRAVRETMAVVSAATAAEPPARLRAATLGALKARDWRQLSWRAAALVSAAAAVVVGAAAFGIGVLMRPPAPSTVAEQVLAAPDVRTVSRPLANGTATVMFSRDRNAGVLVMNNVPPPSPGTVYQMWLISANGPASAGTMGAAAVSPSTKATLANLGSSTALAFTVEPGAGSPQPTTPILAELPLS